MRWEGGGGKRCDGGGMGRWARLGGPHILVYIYIYIYKLDMPDPILRVPELENGH